jgi:hypothetical protein
VTVIGLSGIVSGRVISNNGGDVSGSLIIALVTVVGMGVIVSGRVISNDGGDVSGRNGNRCQAITTRNIHVRSAFVFEIIGVFH